MKQKKSSGRGEYKIEFFALINEIRARYNSGQVVAKIMYDDLLQQKKITMDYFTFVRYFRIHIKPSATSDSMYKNKGEQKQDFQENNFSSNDEKIDGPIKIEIKTNKSKISSNITHEVKDEDQI